MREFSRTLTHLSGDVQQQIGQMLDQIRRMQEETEDMFRELETRVERMGDKLAQVLEEG